MNKFISISIAVLLFFSVASAQQKRYLYVDSSLLRNESSYDDTEVMPADEETGTPSEDHTLNTEVSGKQGTDTSLYLNGLSVPADSVRRWKNAKEFAYIRYIDSLLKDKQDKEKKKPKQSEPTGPGFLDRLLSSGFVQALLWTLAGLFILFIVYRLFLSEGVFRRESKSAKAVNAEVEEEQINSETDFDALVKQALQQNNLRLAVRYQYLRSLHKLAAKELLQLAPDKTNYQYVRELKDASLQNGLASLTLNYEYVWYGEFDVDRETYQKIETGFKNFNQKI